MTNEKIGLYIHIPFCRKKCYYCGFYSLASLKYLKDFVDALRIEFQTYGKYFRNVDTIYFGGGTPSFIGAENIKTILNDISSIFVLDQDCEITVECNPEDLSYEFIEALSESIVTRIVIGIQSFFDQKLELLGRSYTSKKAREVLRILKASTTSTIGMDLIYGTIFDNLDLWRQELDTTISFYPDHISCYELTIEPKTRFSQMKTFQVKMEEKYISEIYIYTSCYLASNGYLHYEVSNFARGLCQIPRHNWKYWKRAPYLGFGPSAHSFYGNRRWWNTSSIRKYLAALGEGCLPIEGREDLHQEQIELETLCLGLRTFEGVKMDSFKVLRFSPLRVKMLKDLGYIGLKGRRVYPTTMGYLISDTLPLELIE